MAVRENETLSVNNLFDKLDFHVLLRQTYILEEYVNND